MHTLNVKTHRRNELIDITDKIDRLVAQSPQPAGIVTVFVPHTTAGVTINENADPDVVHDLLLTFEDLIPQHNPGYRHGEGNSDAHAKATLVGSSASILFENHRLNLGTWQALYFCEFDGPRTRKVFVHISP